ncbi:MAG TPA: GH3 auxin-responsive promoter family protein [Polyangiaceae bacterium]|nr:GH3 auxin-responsive promoter family protein [Polyangiaceae bacterium]
MTTPEMSEVPQAAPSVRDFSRGGSGVVRPIARDARARELRRAPYPALVGAVLQRASRFSVAAWDRALRDVRRVQESQLLALLDHAKDTEFGRAHGFAGIRSYEDYVKQVPVGDYDSFSPFIDRMRKGEQNLLVPEFVRWFGNSSGSSNHGKPKFLPITMRQVKQQQRAGTDTVMRYLDSSGNAEMFGGGFTLGLFPPITMREEGPVLITSNPALMSTQMPAIARPCYLPDDEVKRIASYEEKLEVVAKKYFDWNVAAVTGTTCWFTLLFDKVLAEAKRRGHPARCVADVWPNLRVLIGGGVSAGPYLPIIREMVGHEVTLVDTYNATEGGVYAASDFSGARGMLVLPHRGTFFEFVPVEEMPNALSRPSPGGLTRVPIWAVERDRPYAIVPTTVSGLYAYTLGDIVRFPQTRPLRMEFMGRLSGCLSVTQELTTHVEIERAVEHALSAVPSRTVDFGAAADVGVAGTAKSRYALFVEFQEGAAPADLAAFTAAFDTGMCAQNRVYREHRSGDVAILPPRVVELRSGGSRAFLEEVTRGNVQGKFPRIIDDTKKQSLLKYAKGSS